MKLTVVFPVLNQFKLSEKAIDLAMGNLSGEYDIQLLIIDNGSKEPFGYLPIKYVQTDVVRHESSIGVYPVFWDALKYATGDVIALLHSDLMICEQDWDARVMKTFEEHEKLGLLGFIGSNEIDIGGGRGAGTTSNFKGNIYAARNCNIESKWNIKNVYGERDNEVWAGSPARVHGRQYDGFTNAAVVDGCAMIFRKSVLEQIPQRENFPPHHFYDRLLSCEVKERGYTVGVLGIACDHISGQTVNKEIEYSDMAREWAIAHDMYRQDDKLNYLPHYHNWDTELYKEAEKQWLSEYRDQKHLVPCVI